MERFPEDSPFRGYRISSHSPLLRSDARYSCPFCSKSRRHYCYSCLRTPLDMPQVRLPVDVTVIKDPREHDSKSTALHAKLLAGDSVSVISPSEMSQEWAESAVLLFPGLEAQTPDQVEWAQVKRILVIDGTWAQARTISRSPCLSSVPRVTLPPGISTCFWRYQSLGDHCLSTIEAIFHILRQAYRLDGEIDDLLWLYSYQYHLIQASYRSAPERRYTLRHRSGYIRTPDSLSPSRKE